MTEKEFKRLKAGTTIYTPSMLGIEKWVVEKHTTKRIITEEPFDGEWYETEDGCYYPIAWAFLTEKRAEKERQALEKETKKIEEETK